LTDLMYVYYLIRSRFMFAWVHYYFCRLMNIFVSFIPFPCPFSVLATALSIYYTSVPAGTKARTAVNK